MPYAFSPINNDQNQAAELVTLIKQDTLTSLSFQLKIQLSIINDVFECFKHLKNLETLTLSVQTKDGFLKILNQNLNREV